MRTSYLLTLFFTALFCFNSQQSNAQITGITLYSPYDAIMPSRCVLPAQDSVLIFGNLTGTVIATDSVRVTINFSDGFDTTVNAIISGGSFYTNVIHYLHLPGTYSTFITATATGGATTTATTSPYSLSDSCSTISGTMYLDLNANCVYDAGEPGMGSLPIYLVSLATGDTTMAAWTDYYGHYGITVVPGNYVIITNEESLGGDVAPSCPASGTYSFTASGVSQTKNFAYECAVPTSFDMSANLYYGNLIAGDNQLMSISAGDWYWYTRFSCSTLSATVTLTLDPRLTYYYSFPGFPAPTVSGSTLTWNISTSSLYYFGLVNDIYVHVADSLTLGDTLCSTLYVTPTALTDTNLANNTVVACTPVGAAFDPNGKAVSPQGTGPQGYIANGTPLSYLVHFQNTGTAPATEVVVKDTIDANLDMKTLHIISSTSPVNIYTSGNIATFRFNNINLPDSATTATGSTGTIEYTIQPKANLAPGTQIQNRAGIYFDHNPVVMTNATLNTIKLPTTGVQHLTGNTWGVSVYPNPANSQVTIASDDQSDFTVSIIDITGRTMTTGKSANGTSILNTSAIPEGLYFIRAIDVNGNVLTTKAEVRH